MDASKYLRAAIEAAHLAAAVAADQDAVDAFTRLLNAFDDGVDPTLGLPTSATTGTPGTTSSSAAVSTIMTEVGITPSGHNAPENDIIAEINRLKGELNTATELGVDLADRFEQLHVEANQAVAERDALAGHIDALKAYLQKDVDPDDYTVQGLQHVAEARGIEVHDATTKAEIAAIINNPPANADGEEEGGAE